MCVWQLVSELYIYIFFFFFDTFHPDTCICDFSFGPWIALWRVREQIIFPSVWYHYDFGGHYETVGWWATPCDLAYEDIQKWTIFTYICSVFHNQSAIFSYAIHEIMSNKRHQYNYYCIWNRWRATDASRALRRKNSRVLITLIYSHIWHIS
jgi:hypothetical protein